MYSVLHGEQAWRVINRLQQADIVRDVWSEIATFAHPDKAPDARESQLWEQVVLGNVLINLHELTSQDLVLLFSGLAILAKRASSFDWETSRDSGDQEPLQFFVASHFKQV